MHRSSSLPTSRRRFLRDLTREVVGAARVRPGERKGGSAPNRVGFTLIMPGGNYPAYWIRDLVMSVDSGFVTPAEMQQHLRLTARCQNGPTGRRLHNGLRIPPFAVPDHINFDGQPVFYPGTFDDKTEPAIAADLRISPHTVHTHVDRLHRKLGVTDRTQLILAIVAEFLRSTESPHRQPADQREAESLTES